MIKLKLEWKNRFKKKSQKRIQLLTLAVEPWKLVITSYSIHYTKLYESLNFILVHKVGDWIKSRPRDLLNFLEFIRIGIDELSESDLVKQVGDISGET